MQNYTTAEKIENLKEDVKLQDQEKTKTILTTDAYALTEAINNLSNKLEALRIKL